MTSPAPELDAEDFVIAYLTPLNIIPAGQIAARMPAQLPLPFMLVQRVAGGDDRVVDRATVQLDTFAADQTTASTTARAVHHAMRQLHAKTVVTVDGNPWNIYACSVEQTPIYLQWEASGGGAVMDRYVARYVIDIRLPSIQGY
jgi:hypothetical protein